jgi:hypothetical protein
MDFKAKQQIIESIDAEVGGLHPLLRSFLDKLENIKRVEYTHGPSCGVPHNSRQGLTLVPRTASTLNARMD